MKNLFLILFLLISSTSFSSDLTLSKPIFYLEDRVPYAIFNVSWENAWNNERNNDGVWIFFKSLLNQGGYRHINVSKSGHSVVSNFSENDLDLELTVSNDAVGMFLSPKNTYRGKIEVSLKVILDLQSFRGVNPRRSTLNVYGIEMVEIPKGGFELGDPDTTALEYGSFYEPNREGEFKGLVTINSEDQELEVSKSGDIYYQAKEGYEGDQKGVIPPSFPKGFSPFYVMKYEPTEGQYVDFLNSLDSIQRTDRLIFKEENYYAQGGTISEKDGNFFSSHPNKPCLFMSWDDAMAYADWSGLRPMTEFEFTKASRGTYKASSGDFPWGNNNKEKIQRYPNENGNLVMINGWEESNLTENTKEYFGASYYWVMDMAGSMWERVITVGHENGRSFTGTNGDGTLSQQGSADTVNWPVGIENSGGIGFRGGGFYGYNRSYHNYNPFSPVAYRTYGGWHGSMRTNSYGTRFVRSTPR